MTAHWIQVNDEKWTMRAEVVRFKAVSGDHGGRNLGCYFMGLCNCVGICNQDGSKVCDTDVGDSSLLMRTHAIILITVIYVQLQAITLDNTSSNTTMCNTVENLHICQQLTWDAVQNQLP